MAAFTPDRLKVAAESRFYTLPALARELGVNERTVYRWNAGAHPPRLDAVRRIASLLDREPGWFYETEEMAA